MIEAIIFKGLKNYKNEIYSLRDLVFIDTRDFFGEEFIGYDADCFHVLVYDHEKPIATGRLKLRSNNNLEAVIEAVAVLEDHRNQYIGDLVVKMLLDQAFSLTYECVYTKSPINISIFFEKIGFKRIEEDQNQEYSHLKINKLSVKKCH